MKRYPANLCVFLVLLLAACAHQPIKDNSKSLVTGPAPSAVVESPPEEKQEQKPDSEVEEIEQISGMPTGQKDLTDPTQGDGKIPMEINVLVKKWVAFFQGRGRELMSLYLSRSTRYLPAMKQILKDRGLPDDLVYIALIESGFSPKATSRVGAAGYWQFMRGTGRDYGLKISPWIDERRDPLQSTVAAADYFSGLYNLFGSWYLAIASYNAGENKIKSLVMRHHTRDFWELILKGRMPKETINYVPKFLAASMIAKSPKKYGFTEIEYQSPFEFDEVKVQGIVSLTRLAKKMEIALADLKGLNPMFRTDFAIPARGGEFSLRVPKGMSEKAQQFIADSGVKDSGRVLAAAHSDTPTFVRYRVKRGESLTEISRKNGVLLADLAKVNKLSRRSTLLAGQTLLIPIGSLRAQVRNELIPRRSQKSAGTSVRASVRRVHLVKRGETLTGIARRYRVPVKELAEANKVPTRRHLVIGDKISIPD